MSKKIKFGIVGSGWRAEYFLNIAKGNPALFDVKGIISRRESKRDELQKKWHVNAYRNVDELMENNEVDFLIVSVSKSAASSVITEIASEKIPVLAETPPATSLDDLIEMNSAIACDAKIQIAEQFFLSPKHSSRLAIVNSGKLGSVHYSHVSNCHGYHGISLIRKTLGIGFENALISAKSFNFPALEGPGRAGDPVCEKMIINDHTLATLDFNGKVGLYDFEKNQHRSWIRSNRILIRGNKGEIHNDKIKYLKDFKTPIEFDLKRINTGENENLEGYFLKGIMGGESWLYKNPFTPARYCDEEISMATTLLKMKEYIDSGSSFYSLAEASQDQYLALKIIESNSLGKEIETKSQVWSK